VLCARLVTWPHLPGELNRAARAPVLGSLALLAVACTEARFDEASDGATAVDDAETGALTSPDRDAMADLQDADLDASPLEDASTPDAWWRPLKRNYAVSIRFFGRDYTLGDSMRFSHEIIMSATVEVDAQGRVHMKAQRCLDNGNVTVTGLLDEFVWPFADRLPIQEFELVMRPEGVRTEAPARPIGFVEQPSGCTPGARMQVAGRGWLPDGQCECRSEPLPMLERDCRIIDADGDGAAGLTVQHRGLSSNRERVRVLDRCQIENGAISASGHIRATYTENYDYLSLSCGDAVCSQQMIAVCPPRFNPVLFEPLADTAPDGSAWECSDVMEQVEAGKLFPTPMLTFPVGPNGC
jgi:hypothetical protein